MIGEYISALSNTAALNGKSHAYVAWGIEDITHNIIGTTFSPHSTKKGNEELESWLLKLLSPRISFSFHELNTEKKGKVIILEIERASNKPVQFQGQEFIRIGSYKKNLKDYPEIERELWRIFDKVPFEEQIALENVPETEILSFLDYPSYFEMLSIPLPENRKSILERLADDHMILRNNAGGWSITNLGQYYLQRIFQSFHT